MANERDTKTVIGHVTDTPDGQVVEIGPFSLKAASTLQVEFDRPLTLTLSDLIPDPQARAGVEAGMQAVLSCESARLDDLLRAGNLDPAADLVGADLADVDFVGSPERPLDLRGWNLSEAALDGSRFEHVLVDDTTILAGASVEGISGDASADRIREMVLAEASSVRP